MLVMDPSSEFIVIHSTIKFVASEIWDELILHSPDTITLDKLVSYCKTDDIIRDCVDKIIETLVTDWTMIQPQAKSELIGLIKQNGFSGHFGNKLFLSEEEQLVIKIRWDISDILFSEEKRKVVETCKKYGLDLDKNEFDPQLGEFSEVCISALIKLLRIKLEIDLAVVQIVSQRLAWKYATDITNRLQNEYFDILLGYPRNFEKVLRSRQHRKKIRAI